VIRESKSDIQVYPNDLDSIKKTDWICNIEILEEIIKNNNNEITYYCGISSKINDLLPLFDKVLLLQVDKGKLEQRLSNRTPVDFAYTQDVQQRMFGWKDKWEQHIIDQ